MSQRIGKSILPRSGNPFDIRAARADAVADARVQIGDLCGRRRFTSYVVTATLACRDWRSKIVLGGESPRKRRAIPGTSLASRRHSQLATGNRHKWQPPLDGYWCVWVNGNWRVTFIFEGTDAVLVGYH
jgi:hypothetical protein